MKMMRSIGGIVALLLLLCVSLVHSPALAAEGSFGTPIGASPVDVEVIDRDNDETLEILVLTEKLTTIASVALLARSKNVPSDAASVVVFQVERDGSVWQESETVLAIETAIKIEEADGFRVTRSDLVSRNPSQLVITGYMTDQADRVLVLSHGFPGIFNLFDSARTKLLNWATFDVSRDLADLYFTEGDASLCLLDVNQDKFNDLAVVTPADKYLRIYAGIGGGKFDVGTPLFESIVGDKGDEPGFVGAANLQQFPGFAETALVIARKGILSNQVQLVIARGDGGFLQGDPIDTTERPRSVVAGDFTSDGIPDLLVAGTSAFVLLPGTGLDLFGMPQFDGKMPGGDITVPSDFSHPIGLIAEDFNLDGNLDLAVANFGDNDANGGSVDIWVGDGAGSFERQKSLKMGAGASPIALVSADFNHDGWMDLAVVNQGVNDLRILMNSGDVPNYTLPHAPSLGQPLAVANLDMAAGDEIIQTYYVEPAVSATIKTGMEPSAAAGLTVTQQITVEHMCAIAGIGYWPATLPTIKALNIATVSKDDNIAKVATTPRGSIVEVAFGCEDPMLETGAASGLVLGVVANAYAGAIETGDLDGDGFTEIIILDPNTSTLHAMKMYEVRVSASASDPSIKENAYEKYDLLGNAAFDFEMDFPTATGLVIGDFYAGSAGQEVALLFSKTNEVVILSVEFDSARGVTGAFSAQAVGWGPTGDLPSAGLASDVDGDGNIDLIIANFNDDTVMILKNYGDLGTTPRALGFDFGTEWVYRDIKLLDGPIAMAAADFNNDGEEEFVVAGYLSKTLVILEPNAIEVNAKGDRIGALQRVEDIEDIGTADAPYSLVAADLNGDGLDDIAILSSAGLEIYPGNGDLSFGEAIIISPEELGGIPLSVAAGDFNDDGSTQIAVSVGDQAGYPAEPCANLWIRSGSELF